MFKMDTESYQVQLNETMAVKVSLGLLACVQI